MLNEFNPFKVSITSLAPKLPGRPVWNSGIRLDRAENPFPPSPAVTEALVRWAAEANRYPEPSCSELRARLSEYVHCDPAELLIGNGSDELIDTIVRCCLNAGDEVLTQAPSFYFYHRSCEINGGRPVFVPTTETMELDVEAILGGITSLTKVVFIANPNNPTGSLASPKVLEDLISRCPCLIVVDECYWEFSGVTVSDWINKYPHLLVLRSFSKAFSLAGMRLGYAIGNRHLLEPMYSGMQPFPVNGATQAVGIAALSDLAYMQSNVDAIKGERTRMGTALRRLGFRCYPTTTNFILAESSGVQKTATEIVNALKVKNIYVWDCTGSPGAGEHHFRVTIGSNEDNTLLLKTLSSLVSGCRMKDDPTGLLSICDPPPTVP